MTSEEVMDSLILDNNVMMHLNQSKWRELLLPINLSETAGKIPKVLNLVGLFFQAKKVNWLIPIVLTLISAVLEWHLSFSTTSRVLVNARLDQWLRTFSFLLHDIGDRMICQLMHCIHNHIPDSVKMELYYSFGFLVDEEPLQKIKLRRSARHTICAIIGGGAKSSKVATLVPWLCFSSKETHWTFECGPIVIDCKFQPLNGTFRV